MDTIILEKGTVRIKMFEDEGILKEQYWSLNALGDWIHIASSTEGGSVGALHIEEEKDKIIKGYLNSVSVKGDMIIQEYTVAGQRIERKTIIEDSIKGWVKISAHIKNIQDAKWHSFYDKFRFELESIWSYAPSLKGFIPDAQYKAPLIMLQSYETETFAIVPDVTVLNRTFLSRCNHSMKLDVQQGSSLCVGFIPARMLVHTVFCEDEKKKWVPVSQIDNSYYLLVSAQEVNQQAYRKAVRLHWERFGTKEQLVAASQQKGTDTDNCSNELWESWRKYTWDNISIKEWLNIHLEDGTFGGGVKMYRWGGNASVYFSSWFNAMRTSFGMALYARRTKKTHLMEKAVSTLRLALHAPGIDGAFKCFVVQEENDATIWGAGDGCGRSTEFGYLGYDMCWTGYWLLKWYEAGLPSNEGIPDKCKKLAGFMIERQDSYGMFNTFFDESGNIIKYKSDWVVAETGPVALFLLELYSVCPESEYLEAAVKGLEFITREIIPTRQWFDFETFWSCSYFSSRDFDMTTGQYPANNLALIQTVDAFQLAHTITGNEHYLETGKILLDYLLLYQQCWTNPVLEGLSCDAMLLGGFTTQNIDAEWSDARQSQAGIVILNYYRKTGSLELLQRGVAALRAQFPVSPSENWAHWGYGNKTGVTSFHWGTGSGMAGIEIEHEFLMDAVIDILEGGGVGVNGLNLTNLNIYGNRIDFDVSSPFEWAEDAIIKFYKVSCDSQYEIYINKMHLGSFGGKDLLNGLKISVNLLNPYLL